MRVVAIVQASLLDPTQAQGLLPEVCGEPVLHHVLRRAQAAKTVDHVLVAASTSVEDEPLSAFGEARGWQVFRGAEHDVMERVYRAAEQTDAECIVRLLGNHPFVDPRLIDEAVEAVTLSSGQVDYCSNLIEPTSFPSGAQVEAFTVKSLARLRRETVLPQWRSEVTSGYLHQPRSDRRQALRRDEDLSHLDWAIKSPEDVEFAETVFGYFGHAQFTLEDVLNVLAKRPHWKHINSQIERRAM